MTEIPSDDVLREAARRMSWPKASLMSSDALQHQYLCGGVYREMCDALTQPAWEPPVSPELRAVEQVREEWRTGELEIGEIAFRAIELCDQYRKEV